MEAGHWWLAPVILATWEAEIGRIMIQASLGKKQNPYLQYQSKKG
jgi:hypothetical protein